MKEKGSVREAVLCTIKKTLRINIKWIPQTSSIEKKVGEKEIFGNMNRMEIYISSKQTAMFFLSVSKR